MPNIQRLSGGERGIFEDPLDFGVSMRPDVLEHKKRDGRSSDGRYCYWLFKHGREPYSVKKGSKLWVASRGRWRGYFVVSGVDYTAGVYEDGSSGVEVVFDSESWHEQDAGPRKPFQGFTSKVPDSAEA